jgi:putative NADH-flavin reductase
MKIALCGATGRAGGRILAELLSRGHGVLAIVRDAGSLEPREGVKVAVDDLSDPGRLARTIEGADALVSAYGPPPTDIDELVRVTERLVEAVARSGVPRLLMVGGAGSLEVAPGVTLLDSGKLPAEWVPIAKAHAEALEVLRGSAVDWTSLCPAAYFDPGERTGRFRVGTDELIVDSEGNSRVSMEDFAIALVDELENPRHPRERFSVGY